MSVYTSASNNTRWKNDFMEKRRRGRSEVPEWKRDLLKRIHSKKALERKQRMDTKPDEDVVEEHIPKVNENVFLVHEKQHPRAPIHNEHIDSTVTNHDVIPQNVIIIENDKNVTPVTNKPTKVPPKTTSQGNVEMPSSGIVHRLMGRFEGGAKTQIRHRSKSATNLWSRKEKTRLGLNDNNNDINKTTKKSNSLSRALSTDTQIDIYASEDLIKDKVIEPVQMEPKIDETKKLTESKSNYAEVEKHYHISNVVPMPYHKTREAHPVKTPILSPKSPVQRNAPSRFAIPKKEPVVVETKTTIDMSSLHATTKNGGVDDIVVNKTVKTPVSDVTPAPVKVKETSVKTVEPRHQDKLPNGEALHSNGSDNINTIEEVTPAPRVNRFRRRKSKSDDKKSTAETNHVKAVPNGAVTRIESTEVKVVNSAPKHEINVTSKQNGMKKSTPNSTSEKLSTATPGSIKFDNVVVNDKNANAKTIKALLDYASKSKTIQITPKKSTPMQETVKPVLPVNNTADVLPATSIDDVIVPVEVSKVEEKPPSVFEEVKKDTLKTTVVEPKPVVRIITPTPRITRPTTVTPSGDNTKSSIFGSRVQRSKPSPQGGRSFVIDPSKFKKQNSPSEQTTTKVTTVTTTTTKRKPTVDEIVVIGGYVKLERSCLTTTSNKKKKTTSIKFNFEEVTHEYISERSLIAEHTHEILQNAAMKKTPGQDKDSTFGKYTPKYLLSMGKELLDNEKITSPQDESVPTDTVAVETIDSTDAKPTDVATKWSEDTSADMLF